MRVVINIKHGGFSLSWIGKMLLRMEFNHPDNKDFGYPDGVHEYMYRTDPILILSVMCMGDIIGGKYSNLKIIEIPDNIDWGIAEYDGMEHVYEVHRTWS